MNKAEFKEMLRENADAQRVFDESVSDAVRTYAANHPPEDTEALRSENAELRTAVAALKTGSHVRDECERLAIPRDLIADMGVTFDDADDATKKLERLAERLETMRNAGINETLKRESFRPGPSSQTETETNLAGMSRVRAEFLESIGELDDVIAES